MTPTLVASSVRFEAARRDEFLRAAVIVRDAAEVLAAEARTVRDMGRYLLAVERLSRAIECPGTSPTRLLGASPAVLDRSGQTRTLVEMIEAEPGADEARLRLAKLLLRALLWRDESFPYPADRADRPSRPSRTPRAV